MAICQRGKKLYLYRSVRRSGRVTSEYFGRGALAEVEAGLAEDRRFRRQMRAWYRQQVQTAGRLTRAFRQAVQQFTDATLYAHGLHRPNGGPWRKRRRIRHAAAASQSGR